MLEIPKVCPECGSKELKWNKEKGEIACKSCGLVVDDKLVDFGKEWKDIDDGESREKLRRTGAPLTVTIFDKGLGTEVGNRADIRKLKGKDRFKYIRMSKQQYRTGSSVDRNLRLALAEMKRISSYLTLTRAVEEEAAGIYTQAVYKGYSRGRPIEHAVAASIYAACRNNDVPRTLDELANASGISKKEIGQTYRMLMRSLGLRAKVSNPADYMSRFISALKLSPTVQSNAVEIVERMSKANMTSGRGPTSLAAAAIYIASLIHNERRTQREIADVCGVTEVTVRNRYRELMDVMDLEKIAHKVYKTRK